MSTTRSTNTSKKHREIIQRYNQIASKKIKGEKLYRKRAILLIVGKEFFLEPGTINNIIHSINI